MMYLRFIFIISILFLMVTSMHAMEKEEREGSDGVPHSSRQIKVGKIEEEKCGNETSASSSRDERSLLGDEAERFLARLKAHVLEGFCKERALVLVREYAPDYSMNPKTLAKRYRSLTRVNGGGIATIWKAVLAIDNPFEGLRAGESIAIRIVIASSKRPIGRDKHLGGIEAHIRCSLLRNMGQDGGVLTEFFPALYGLFYGPSISEICDYTNSGRVDRCVCQYQEMEFVDTTFESEIWDWVDRGVYQYQEMEFVDTTFQSMPARWKIPDSVVFEFAFGEWAGISFVGLSILDGKARNYGLKTVPYGRYYHLGEDRYYFPSGQMPVRLDLESFHQHSLPPIKRFGGCALDADDAESLEGQRFLSSFYQRGVEISDIFTLFRQYFGIYRKEREWVERYDPSARNFYLDTRWIERERAFPPNFLPIR